MVSFNSYVKLPEGNKLEVDHQHDALNNLTSKTQGRIKGHVTGMILKGLKVRTWLE